MNLNANLPEVLCGDFDGRVSLLRGKCLYRETNRKVLKLKREIAEYVDEDQADVAIEERICQRRKKRRTKEKEARAQLCDLTETLGQMRRVFGDALLCDMDVSDEKYIRDGT